MKEKLKEFFKNKNYDIRKRGDARWIDQNVPVMCFQL